MKLIQCYVSVISQCVKINSKSNNFKYFFSNSTKRMYFFLISDVFFLLIKRQLKRLKFQKWKWITTSERHDISDLENQAYDALIWDVRSRSKFEINWRNSLFLINYLLPSWQQSLLKWKLLRTLLKKTWSISKQSSLFTFIKKKPERTHCLLFVS